MRHIRKIMGSAAVATTAAGALLLGQAGGAAAATSLSVNWNFPAGFLPNAGNQNTAPPGAIAVDWRDNVTPAKCTSSIHPVPVLLIHGTWENQSDNWQAMSPWLANNGYCVYSLTYGNSDTGNPLGGTIHVWESAAQIGQAVDLVLKATGAPQLDFVGHSQGAGISPSWYLDFLMRDTNHVNANAGANPVSENNPAIPSKVRNFVMLAPSLHGTTLSGIATLGQALSALNILGIISVEVPAASDQTTKSAATTRILSFGDTAPGVHYTAVIEKGDQVVTPYTQQILGTDATHPLAAGSSINNIILQNSFSVVYHNDKTGKTTTQLSLLPCPADGGEHLALPYNSRAGRIVTDTLGGDISGAYLDPYCHVITPLVGG